jgi:hypothetical protein
MRMNLFIGSIAMLFLLSISLTYGATCDLEAYNSKIAQCTTSGGKAVSFIDANGCKDATCTTVTCENDGFDQEAADCDSQQLGREVYYDENGCQQMRCTTAADYHPSSCPNTLTLTAIEKSCAEQNFYKHAYYDENKCKQISCIPPCGSQTIVDDQISECTEKQQAYKQVLENSCYSVQCIVPVCPTAEDIEKTIQKCGSHLLFEEGGCKQVKCVDAPTTTVSAQVDSEEASTATSDTETTTTGTTSDTSSTTTSTDSPQEITLPPTAETATPETPPAEAEAASTEEPVEESIKTTEQDTFWNRIMSVFKFW